MYRTYMVKNTEFHIYFLHSMPDKTDKIMVTLRNKRKGNSWLVDGTLMGQKAEGFIKVSDPCPSSSPSKKLL